MLNAWLRPKLAWLGVNRAVFYGVLSKISSAFFGATTLVLVGWRFTPELQGYYFTFANVIALQVLAELGLATVIVQFASHFWALLKIGPDGRIEGEPEAMSRFASLGRLAAAWYGVSGVLVAAGVGLSGYLFFKHSSRADVAWQGPWLALAGLTGLKLWLIPYWALVEGSNQVSAVYVYRAFSPVFGGLAIWSVILWGGGLWAAPVGVAAEVACSFLFLAGRHAAFLRLLTKRPEGPRVSWRREIWPVQARIAVSWVCGFFVFSIFTPILFRYHGAAAAGQWGMTWTVLSLIFSTASLWVLARVPQFGIWIARHEYDSLDREFARVARVSVFLTALGSGAVWIAVLLVQGQSAAARALPPLPAGLLALASVLLQIPGTQAAYLRAHRQEPLALLSVVQAILTAAGALALGIPYGAVGMSAAYLAVIALLLPVGTWIWVRCRREWHDRPANSDYSPERAGGRT